jgi:hypothetical protein
VLALLAHEMTVAEAASRHGVSAESINRWRNRFVDAPPVPVEVICETPRTASVGALAWPTAWQLRGDGSEVGRVQALANAR